MTIKEISKESFHEFQNLLRKGLRDFIPMLPFVKSEFQDFERYLKFHEKATYVIDEISETENCIYHFYTLPDAEDVLRVSLIIPSSFENRVDITEKSLGNIKSWLSTKPYKSFMIQTLEHGEVEYYPTLSTYLIPSLLKLGFNPHYRVYLTTDKIKLLSEEIVLPEGIKCVPYNDDLQERILDFYFSKDANGYFNPFYHQEFLSEFNDAEFTKTARFLVNNDDDILGGIFSGRGSGKKVWIDNLKVLSSEHEETLAKYLISNQLDLVNTLYPGEETIIYLSREFKKPMKFYESFGYYGFEFWVDSILEIQRGNSSLSYRNAKDILPKELLEQVQKYVQGEQIYIPQEDNKRTEWGKKSGAVKSISFRNKEIFAKYQEGYSYEELAQMFFLSTESIRKIIYSLKRDV